ncbi:MAG: ATP synthase F1 subunit epsilon [Candidatus Doudnabacteria bacterium]|nr:ATP synthase F1 subunit epsilon [Candidatus Doudnabacteria bacterium]
MKLKIATPERVIYEADVDAVSCPTEMGEITILPNHIPLVANLKPGELKVMDNSEPRYIFVAGGFVEVRPGNEVMILADAAEREEEIDIARAEEARKRAQKLLGEKIQSEEEYAAVAASLEKSLARLKISKRRKYRDVGKKM